MKECKKVAIIGAGAAGYFAALSAAQHHPNAEVTLYEKTAKVLSKVKISGGGRCNVTHNCNELSELLKAYPRGGRKLKSIFYQFNSKDTVNWFKERGVAIKAEADGRMFPVSDQSQTIIDCLAAAADKQTIRLELSTGVKALKQEKEKWIIVLANQERVYDNVIVTTGGNPKRSSFDWLAQQGHKIIPPVPSLFTFNMPEENITALMGVVAPHGKVSIAGTKIKTEGPILVTHWGLSGPAVLKASAFGARILAEKKYCFDVQIGWVDQNPNELLSLFEKTVSVHPHKKIMNHNPLELPNRLWHYLLERTRIPQDRRWNELGLKNSRRLIEHLTNDLYKVNGKTTFKEEFVTCGGVSLSDVDLNTMESKKAKGLYFAGEVLDIDAITGGYNFQAAWSSGYVAGKLGEKLAK